MITDQNPLTLAEVKTYIRDTEGNKEILGYLKKFTKLKPEDSDKLKKDIDSLKLMKLNPEHLVKIVDFVPVDKEELSKVLTELSLDENESNSIVEVVKKYAK